MSRDDDWSDPTQVELPDATRPIPQGGIVGSLTRQWFGDPDPKIKARMEFRARVRTVQEVAIMVAIIVLAILAAAVLFRLYFVVGDVWT